MAMISKIRRQRGALVMTIPSALRKLLHVEAGAKLELDVVDGKLIAQPVVRARKRYSLAELLEGSDAVTALNAQTAWAREGQPVRHELV
ncbi:MAG: SpoVT/AbrB protein [Rhizobacter sp.]|nr:SpoVT/AbrB protein [Rhizobacter sp.]